MSSAPPPDKPAIATAAYLSMPDERRTAAMAHAALLGETVRKVAVTLPLGADVDDFRRVLVSEGRK